MAGLVFGWILDARRVSVLDGMAWLHFGWIESNRRTDPKISAFGVHSPLVWRWQLPFLAPIPKLDLLTCRSTRTYLIVAASRDHDHIQT